MTGLAAAVVAIVLGQAPPPTYADWQAKWLDANGSIVLDQPYLDSKNLAYAELVYVWSSIPPTPPRLSKSIDLTTGVSFVVVPSEPAVIKHFNLIFNFVHR